MHLDKKKYGRACNSVTHRVDHYLFAAIATKLLVTNAEVLDLRGKAIVLCGTPVHAHLSSVMAKDSK